MENLRSRNQRPAKWLKGLALVALLGAVVPLGLRDAGAHGDNSDPDFLHLCVYTPTGQISFRLPTANPACNFANRTVIHVPSTGADIAAGPAGADGAAVLMSSATVFAAGADTFLYVGVSGDGGASSAPMPIPLAGTIDSLQGRALEPPGVGQEYEFQLVVNGSDVGTSCTIADLQTSCWVNPGVEVSVGDLITARFTGSAGSPDFAQRVAMSLAIR